MKREIKFRGFAKMAIDRMIELQIPVTKTGWVYGHLLDGHICGEIIESEEEYITPSFWVPVDPESVGQFTGLKDKGGKDIYEGDIIVYSDKSVLLDVAFDEGSFVLKRQGKTYVYNINPKVCEVIGNIHENQELL